MLLSKFKSHANEFNVLHPIFIGYTGFIFLLNTIYSQSVIQSCGKRLCGFNSRYCPFLPFLQ